MRISDRVQAMQNSPIRKFNPLADAATAEGVKIYHLNNISLTEHTTTLLINLLMQNLQY